MSSVQTVEENTTRKYQLLIDGQWVDAASGKTFTTPNPATGETLAEIAEADKEDIDQAVTAARKAFEGKWSKVSARDRGRMLYKLSQLIEEHTPELAALETLTTASPSRSRRTLICRRLRRTLNTSQAGPRRSKAKQFRSPGRCSTTLCESR